jgi:pimeloyl-ACP methyl ester carboxylesterase
MATPEDTMKLATLTWGSPTAERVCTALHGITANAGAFTTPAELLAEAGYFVVAPDLRGHGRSPKPDGGYDATTLLEDIADSIPVESDLLIGHSFGGYLAHVGVLNGTIRPRSLLLEDPVSLQADLVAARVMLHWDRDNYPRSIEGVCEMNPYWSRLDAAWKVLSLEQVDFERAEAAFADAGPWDLRPTQKELAERLPVKWVLPEESRFVTGADRALLISQVGSDSVVVVNEAGHSIHRDRPDLFVSLARSLAESGGDSR